MNNRCVDCYAVISVLTPNGKIPAAGTNYSVQLYAGPRGTAEVDLKPIGEAAFFRTGVAAGYIACGQTNCTRVINSVPPGGRAAVQLRAWSTVGAQTFEAASQLALMDTNIVIGQSRLFEVDTGYDFYAYSLFGLESFTLTPVPLNLQIRRTSSGIVLSWPGYASNYVLQASQSVNGFGTVNNEKRATLFLSRWTVVVEPIDSTQFYRLQKK